MFQHLRIQVVRDSCAPSGRVRVWDVTQGRRAKRLAHGYLLPCLRRWLNYRSYRRCLCRVYNETVRVYGSMNE